MAAAHERVVPAIDMTHSTDQVPTVEVSNLKRYAGRQSYHYEPDFCGRLNVVLDEASPDRVTFSCQIALTIDQVYILSYGENRNVRARIRNEKDHHYTARVVGPRSDGVTR